jgi:hypothetical protein
MASRGDRVTANVWRPSEDNREVPVEEDTRAIVPLEGSAPSETDAAQELTVHPPEELAAGVAKVLELIAERLELETPHPSTARRVRGARTVSREFVLSLMAAADRRPDRPFFAAFDSAEARAVLQSEDAYRLTAERTAMFLASLKYTIEARWAKVVADAMHAFKMASIFAEDPKNADLAAEVENMGRHLGRKGIRKKKAKKGEPAV